MSYARRHIVTASWLVALPFWACRGGEHPSQSPALPTGNLLLAAASVALPPPGMQPGDLPDSGSAGAKLLAQYCTACHALPSPAAHSATDWPSVMRRMWLRMERLDPGFGVPVPGAAERLAILRYVLAHALRVSPGDLPPGRGRDLFVTACGRCHELPDPRQHSAEDWPAVVTRMRDHMEVMLGWTPTASELRDVIAYLNLAGRR